MPSKGFTTGDVKALAHDVAVAIRHQYIPRVLKEKLITLKDETGWVICQEDVVEHIDLFMQWWLATVHTCQVLCS